MIYLSPQMDLFKLFQKSKNNSFIYFHCSKTKKNLFGTSKKFFFFFNAQAEKI